MKHNRFSHISIVAAVLVVGILSGGSATPSATSLFDRIFIDSKVKLKKSTSDFPADLVSNFIAIAPGENGDRQPAAATRNKAAKIRTKEVVIANRPQARKSRLPASVSDGFEYRVRIGKQVSTFWVVKRKDRSDLLFANNSGSRASVGLSKENFQSLLSTALSLNAKDGDISACPAASIQIHVVANGIAERTMSSCLTSKSTSVVAFRDLGGALSSYVR